MDFREKRPVAPKFEITPISEVIGNGRMSEMCCHLGSRHWRLAGIPNLCFGLRTQARMGDCDRRRPNGWVGSHSLVHYGKTWPPSEAALRAATSPCTAETSTCRS
jgi:hypothetical protein